MARMDLSAADAMFNGSIIALVAAATTVVLDLFGFLNVALAASFVLGSTTAFAFASAGAPQWQWIAAAALVGFIGGFAIDRLAFDPLRRRGRNASMVPAGIGASLIVYGLVRAAFSPSASAMAHAFRLSRIVTIGEFSFTELQAIAVIATVVSCVLLDFAVRKTRFGNGVRAARENPLAAQLMGIRIDRVPSAAMAVTGAMASASGAMYTAHAGSLGATMPPALLLDSIAVIALAPIGSVGWACVIAYALSFASALLSAKLSWLPGYAPPLTLLALIAAGLALRRVDARVRAATAEM